MEMLFVFYFLFFSSLSFLFSQQQQTRVAFELMQIVWVFFASAEGFISREGKSSHTKLEYIYTNQRFLSDGTTGGLPTNYSVSFLLFYFYYFFSRTCLSCFVFLVFFFPPSSLSPFGSLQSTAIENEMRQWQEINASQLVCMSKLYV
jgi:hypothetical protein